MKTLIIAAAALLGTPGGVQEWSKVAEVFGKPGTVQPDGAYRVTFPRTDFAHYGRDSHESPPGMGLTSTVSFMAGRGVTLASAEFVVSSDEIRFVLSALLESKIEVTALRHHEIGFEPQVFKIQCQAIGETSALAKGLKEALDQTVRTEEIPPDRSPTVRSVDWSKVSGILKRSMSGADLDGVRRSVLPRTDLAVMLDGQPVAPSAGQTCWAAFFHCTCGRTQVSGEVVCTRSELQRVIGALLRHNLPITGIAQRSVGLNPTTSVVQFSKKGEAVTIAAGIRAAWDEIGPGQAGRPVPAG